MPRQSRSRPSAPRVSSTPSQSRGAHTAALPSSYSSTPSTRTAPTPPAQAQAHTQTKQPGMIAQMAATAGSVAVGSTIGHGISNMLFGGREAEPVPPQAPQVQAQAQGVDCAVQAKDFTACLEKADLQSCSYYLEQLKACQAAAAPY